MPGTLPIVPPDLQQYLQPMPPAVSTDITLDPKASPREKLFQGLRQGGIGVLAPDGTPGFVHGSIVNQFLKNNPGYKTGVVMTAPDGTPGFVAKDEAAQFLKDNPTYQVGTGTTSVESNPLVSQTTEVPGHPGVRIPKFEQPTTSEKLFPPLGAFKTLRNIRLAANLVRENAKQEGEAPGAAPIVKNVIGPAGEASAEFLGSQFEPENLALLGAFKGIPKSTAALRTLQRGAGAYFTGKMGLGAGEQAKASYEAAKAGNIPEAVKQGVGAGFQGGFAAEGAKGTLESTKGALQDLRNTPGELAQTGPGQAIVKSRPVQAIQAAITPAEKLTVPQAITRAAVPKGKLKAQWRQAVVDTPKTMADARRAADNLGMNVDTMGPQDALDATRQAKKDIWKELQVNHPTESSSADTTPVGQKILSTISKRSVEEGKGWTKDAVDRALRYSGQQMPLSEIEDRVTELNSETRSMEAMMPADKRAAQLKPENRPTFAERDALRELLLQRLNETTGPGARELRKRYGNLSVMESALSRRIEDLASKSTDESELWKLGKIRSAGRIIRGGVTAAGSIATGQPLGAALGVGSMVEGAKQLQAQRMADLKRNPEFLIRKAFRETTPTPQASLGGPIRSPISGLLRSAPVIAGPAPEQAYVPPLPPPFNFTTRAQRLGLLLKSPPTELPGQIETGVAPPSEKTTRAQRRGLLLKPAPTELPGETPPEGVVPAAKRLVRNTKTGRMTRQYLTAAENK